MDQKTQYYYNVIYPKLIRIFNRIRIKIPAGFTQTDKLILKYV